MNAKLKAVVDAIDTYQLTYPEDACVLIFDTEKVVGYKAGKTVDLKIKVGETVEQHINTTSVHALKSGKHIREERGPELFGFAYIASAVPIFDNGQVVGVCTGVISNDTINELRHVSNDLSASVAEMSVTTEELTNASVNVSKQLEELSHLAETATHDIQQINSIVKSVKDIAQKSKILGLNAGIEAARSGVHGRGFAIVANEIQKMAQDSNQSADTITKELENIKHSIEYINNSTAQISSFTQEYTANMQQMSHTYTSLNIVGQKLMNLSNIRK
ncbi:methyl-accepting chemotaxis protein (MCP) signalling protein [Ureibacillus xyleni]|uniref:Methyl-accepting chemotaxis protein (MCP) signalling protein n=1 Tax=Ureibacillus xyleni TaxID=614648 RepID=A0A285TJT5_9BACL|nr:methyl-accepting chemotaxis protein [Ureibacillus xyleni]SOC22369.1 methyl-accepting chemotaxis protein (MCP) signalling protein [Ureibacillus xyleni]